MTIAKMIFIHCIFSKWKLFWLFSDTLSLRGQVDLWCQLSLQFFKFLQYHKIFEIKSQQQFSEGTIDKEFHEELLVNMKVFTSMNMRYNPQAKNYITIPQVPTNDKKKSRVIFYEHNE